MKKRRSIRSGIEELEDRIGFPLKRRKVGIEDNDTYDETLSYGLAFNFYGRNNEVKELIEFSYSLLSYMMKRYRKGDCSYLREIQLLSSLIGNLYYILGNFKASASYFLNAMLECKDDITPLIELIFSLRAMGKFELFETSIFNFEILFGLWQKDPDVEMSQEKLYFYLDTIMKGESG